MTTDSAKILDELTRIFVHLAVDELLAYGHPLVPTDRRSEVATAGTVAYSEDDTTTTSEPPSMRRAAT